MGVWLWHWNQSSIIPLETSRRAKTEKSRKVQSNLKVFLTIFFNSNGVAYHEFSSQGRTVNKEYYLEVMRRLCEAFHPIMINALAHTSMVAWVFTQKQNRNRASTSVFMELATADFLFCPKLKTPMDGKRFATIEEIKEKSKRKLLAEVFWELEKNACKSILYLGGITLKGTR